MAENYLQRIASAGARTVGGTAAPAATGPSAMPTPVSSFGSSPWRGTIHSEEDAPWPLTEIAPVRSERFDSPAAGQALVADLTAQAGSEPLPIGEPREPGPVPAAQAPDIAAGQAASPPLPPVSPGNPIVPRPDTGQLIMAPAGLRPRTRPTLATAPSAQLVNPAASDEPASAGAQMELRPTRPQSQSGPVITAPAGLRSVPLPLPGGVYHLADPLSPSVAPEPSATAPTPPALPSLPLASGIAHHAGAITAAPQPEPMPEPAALDYNPLRPPQPIRAAAPEPPTTSRQPVQPGGSSPAATASVLSVQPVPQTPWLAPQRPPVTLPDVPAPGRSESRISIGRIEVQVNNNPAQAVAPPASRLPAAPHSAALLFDAKYLDRFTLLR